MHHDRLKQGPPYPIANSSNTLFSSPRRPGPDGEGGVEAWDGMTPLHLARDAGLDNVVQTLVEHKVNVNSKVCHGFIQHFLCILLLTLFSVTTSIPLETDLNFLYNFPVEFNRRYARYVTGSKFITKPRLYEISCKH